MRLDVFWKDFVPQRRVSLHRAVLSRAVTVTSWVVNVIFALTRSRTVARSDFVELAKFSSVLA